MNKSVRIDDVVHSEKTGQESHNAKVMGSINSPKGCEISTRNPTKTQFEAANNILKKTEPTPQRRLTFPSSLPSTSLPSAGLEMETVKNSQETTVSPENGEEMLRKLVKKEDLWVVVYDKLLKHGGWVLATGSNLHARLYIRPNCKGPNKGGVHGKDYLTSEYELKTYAIEKYGWGGDDKYASEKELVEKESQGSHGQMKKRELSDSATEKEAPNVDKKDSFREKQMDDGATRDGRTKNHPPPAPSHQPALSTEDRSEGGHKLQSSLKDKHTVESSQATACSLSPLALPEREKYLKDKLKCCQKVLHPSYNIHKPAAVTHHPSSTGRLATKIKEIDEFLHGAVSSCGYSQKSLTQGQKHVPAFLYVCGGPGTGKTTIVNGRCKETALWAKRAGYQEAVKTCFMNASPLAAASAMHSNHLEKKVMERIGNCLGLKCKTFTSGTIEKVIDSKSRYKNKRFVILVLDEIDMFLSERGKAGPGEKLLQLFSNWASMPDFMFSIVGISNYVSNVQTRRLFEIMKTYKYVTFPTYNKTELIDIIEQRVGRTLIQPKAVELVASRVELSSGDCRKALELASRAVGKCIENLSEDQAKMTTTEGPVVKLTHVAKAMGENYMPFTKLINDLPEAAKVVLCAAVTLSRVRPTWEDINMRLLQKYCSDAGPFSSMNNMGLEHFRALVDQLCDAGLLIIHRLRNNFVDGPKVRLGVPVEDVESAIKTVLTERIWYRRIVKRIENDKSGVSW